MKSNLKTITKMRFILIAAFSFSLLIIFAFYLLISNSILNMDIIENKIIINYFSIFFSILLIPFSMYVYNVYSKKSKNESNANIIFFYYKKAFRYKLIILVSLLIINILSYIFTSDSQFIYITLITLIFLFVNFPSESKYQNDFQSDEK